MELKSLKIDSDLHEKLKSLSDEKNTSMQNLVEKKLSELISHEEDILFNINKVDYNHQFKMYNLQLTDESFKKLINFFEIFLTNRNLKNINEIENLLKLITTLKNHADVNKKASEKPKETSTVKNMHGMDESLIDLIKKATNQTIDDVNEKVKAKESDFDYSNIETGYNNSLRTLLTQLDSVRYSLAKNDLKEAFESLNGHDFIKPVTTEDTKKLTFEKKIKIMENLRLQIAKPQYLKIDDVVKDPKTNFEYKVDKIYHSSSVFESSSYVLKGITALTMDVEMLLTMEQLIKANYLIDEKLVLEVIDAIDFSYDKMISKLAEIKNSISTLSDELVLYRSRANITNHEEVSGKIDILNNSELELDFDLLKDLFMKTKIWFEEFKLKNTEF
jgi:hypothetical protein